MKTSKEFNNQNSSLTSKQTKTVHQARRAATRERLIQATIDLLRQEGIATLNTVNITRAAGIVQSGFYLHFKNIDEAKRVAAEQVADRIRNYVARHRRRVHNIDQESFDLLRAHCQKMLEIFETERGFAEVFLQYRYDRSPLGDVMRELQLQLHQDLVSDLYFVIYQTNPIPEAERERISLHAQLILAAALTTGEALMDKRVDNIKLAADLLALVIMSSTSAAFLEQNKLAK